MIHPEGLKIAAGVEAGALATMMVCPPLALPVALFGVAVLAFFRDPERTAPADPEQSAVLAPADGRVVYAGMDGSVMRVSIFMSVTNVHVNRAPVAGVVERMRYREGKFFNASLDKASEHNERMRYLIRRPDGRAVVVTQVAGLIARRIVPFVAVGDRVRAGERIGLIRFGSRADVHLAPCVLKVKVGDRVRAGETVLAIL